MINPLFLIKVLGKVLNPILLRVLDILRNLRVHFAVITTPLIIKKLKHRVLGLRILV